MVVVAVVVAVVVQQPKRSQAKVWRSEAHWNCCHDWLLPKGVTEPDELGCARGVGQRDHRVYCWRPAKRPHRVKGNPTYRIPSRLVYAVR